MATKDEAREAADGTEVQVEAVDLGTVHLQEHPEVKLPSIMEIKNVREIINSTEGTLEIPEDQVLVEAPSEVELPPEHNLTGKASSLDGHMDKEEKISNVQLHENDQEEAELNGTSAHQSNRINKEVTDGLSHEESTTEGSSLVKQEQEEEEEPRDDQQDSEAVDDDLVQEDTLKTDSSIEQTDNGQQDQNKEPEKVNEDTQPASDTNNADFEEADATTGFKIPVEPHLDDSGAVPETIDEKKETEEPTKADAVIHPGHKESFPEDMSMAGPTEEVVNVDDQQSQQDDTMDADVVQEDMLKCEETHVQEEVPKSEAHEPTTNAQEMLNKESAEEIDDPMNGHNEKTVYQSNMEAPKETVPELDTTMRAPLVNVQVQKHEPSEEIEHAEAVGTEEEMEQSSVPFEEATLEDQPNFSVKMDNDTVQGDTPKSIEQKDDGQQDQDIEPEKEAEDTQRASMENTPDVEVVAEAPSGVQTPLEPILDKSDAIPDTIDENTEADEPAEADGVLHPDHKESSPEDASIAEPIEEVLKVEDQQSQQADAMDADVVQEEVPKSEHADEPENDAHEVLNQESTEETDSPVNKKTEETALQSNMEASEETTTENDTTMGEPSVNIQAQNQESVEEIEDAEAVDTEAAMQQSSVSLEEEVPEDQRNLGITMDGDTVQEGTVEAIEQTEDDPQDQDLSSDKATVNTQPTSMENIPDVEVVTEAPYGVQTPVDINLDNSDATTDTTNGNTETGESAKAEGAAATNEPQVTEIEEEANDNEATDEAQEFTEHSHVTPPNELSAEDDSTANEPHNDDIQQTLGQDSVEVKETVFTSEENIVEDNETAEEPTCDSQEVDNAESTEETKGDTAENTAEVSDMVIVNEVVEEQNVLQTVDTAETHMRELEQEETKNTKSVESEEAPDQRNAILFNELAQEDTPESEMQQTESATETAETEAAPQESNDRVSEQPSPEDHRLESKTDCDTQEVSITESLEVIDGDKDIITGGTSGQRNMVSVGRSAQQNDVPKSEPTSDIQSVQEQEPEPEEIKNTELVEVKETSQEMNTTVFQQPAKEDNPAIIDLHEAARELSNTETPHKTDAAQSEEQTPEEIASEPQALEPESVEGMNDPEATEPSTISQVNLISTCGESVPEEIATEDNITNEPDVTHDQLHQESADFKESEADKPQDIASSCAHSTSEQSTSEDNATATEPSSNTQTENSEPAEVTEGTENVIDNTALAEAATPEEHIETDATADTPQVEEPELEETKDVEPAGTDDIMTSSYLPAENLDMETMGTEAVPLESHVESIKELTEDDTEPVLELEPVEDTKGTVEHLGEPRGSPSDEPAPTEGNTTVTEPAFDTQKVQNLTSEEIKDSEDAKTYGLSHLSFVPTPEEANQESNLLEVEPLPDVQQVQELCSTEKTRDIESVGTEDHQQHGVSILEELAVESEANVDDQQVREERLPEVKDNEAMESEEVIQQSNIVIPEDATEERSELRSDPDFYVQPAQQVELSRDSENSQLVRAEETSGQINVVALEETHTEDSVASGIDPPVDIKEENEQEPMEEIKGIDFSEAEGEFHTSQVDAIEKPASEGNKASIETSYDIKQDNELELTKEINGIEAINDVDQTENATSEDPSPKDNETTPEGHPAVLNEETTGNETNTVMLVPGIKDEIQKSLELKDDACENVTDEDAVQSPCDDILETSNNNDQVKEEQKDGCEHNSGEISGALNEGDITHVQDRDISGELLTKGGTEEASQVLLGRDPHGAQDVTEKDGTAEGGEQTSDLNSQPEDVAIQRQACEADALSIARQDEIVQKIDLDQQQKEDEIESPKKELQKDEQKHEDKRDDFTMELLAEPEGIENGATDRTEDTDACEAQQTEAAITETVKHEEASHVSEESTPISTGMKVDNVNGTEEDADAKNDNKNGQESAEKDDIVAKDSTSEQDETTDEIINEELEPDLASSSQEASDPTPPNDDILQNDPASITQNVESGEHREDKERTNKVNDDVHAIQASEEDITDEIEENKDIQNEDNAIHHDESQKKPEEEEAPQLHSIETCNMDAKMDDTKTLGENIIHGNASINPREIEDIGESKGLGSTSEPFVEPSIYNNVEQDLSNHHKVEDEKLSMMEQNAVDIEAMQEKADAPALDINQTKQCQEEINTDDFLQLKVEENSFEKIDETVSHDKTDISTTEAAIINDTITDKAIGADSGPSDGSLQTFNDTGRDLNISSLIIASKEESVNEIMQDHKLALPAHTAQDENTLKQALCLEKTEREMPSSENLLPTEPEENQTPNESNEEASQDENQIPNEKNEENMQDTGIGVAQKEVEQDLPVSHFLMNLILGKKNSDANENSESEAERKQEETTEDSSALISKQEESLGPLPTENKVHDNLTFEQEKHDAKCSQETQEMVEEQSDDLKLDTERSINDEEFDKNTHDLEIAAYQGNPQDNISSELLSEEAASVSTKIETIDIEVSNLEMDDRAVDTMCQENTLASTEIENGSLKSNNSDLTSAKASGEDTPEEGQIRILHESLPEDKSADEVSEQIPLSTELGMNDAKVVSGDAGSVQNLSCAKQDEPTESSINEATSTPDTQLECEQVEKKEDDQHASTDAGHASEEVEDSNENLQKSTSSEVTTNEQAPQITEPVSDTDSNENLRKSTSSEGTTDEEAPQITKPVRDTEKILANVKEISEGLACMDVKENSNFSSKGVENIQTAFEIQADGPNMQINQDKEGEVADNKAATEPEKLGESDFEEHQETDTEQKSPKATDEGGQHFFVKQDPMVNEQAVPGTVESHEETMNIKSNEEQELFDSKVQERDLNVVSPREASEAEENFVEVTKPEFSTDGEQSPRADAEEKTYDDKVKDIEGTKNFTDGAAMKTEAPVATQKAHKKHSLLSGVGSKVKHQLAKVKKAIVGKPGSTKPDSPKS